MESGILVPDAVSGGVGAVELVQFLDSPNSVGDSDRSSSYFGLTSQLYLSSHRDPPPETTSKEESLASAIHLHSDSEQLISLLLRSFFRDQRLWVDVVHEKTFRTHRERRARSQWYCTFLESVLLACGARGSTSSTVRSLRYEYAKRAKAELLTEIESPTPASMQGCLLLSEYEVSQGNDRFGWMLCGETWS